MIDSSGYIKIVDYALTQILFPSQATTTISTNLDYLAPELTTEQPYENFSKSVDWWSIGIIMCELLTGQTPYYASTKTEILSNINLNKMDFLREYNCSIQMKDLIRRLLAKEENDRIGHIAGFREILHHPWFSEINTEAIENMTFELPAELIPFSHFRPNETNFDFVNKAPRLSKRSKSVEAPYRY